MDTGPQWREGVCEGGEEEAGAYADVIIELSPVESLKGRRGTVRDVRMVGGA